MLETPIEQITLEDGAIRAVSFAGGRAHRFDTLYSAFGVTPRFGLADGLGAAHEPSGRLIVDEHQETSVDGLFAAGDLVRGLNQLSVAAGEGAIAATAVHNRLPKQRA